MKYEIKLNGRTYEVEVEVAEPMSMDTFRSYMPAAPVAAAPAPAVAAPAVTPAMVAAVAAVIAEEMGTSVDAIRIVSMKKL